MDDGSRSPRVSQHDTHSQHAAPAVFAAAAAQPPAHSNTRALLSPLIGVALDREFVASDRRELAVQRLEILVSAPGAVLVVEFAADEPRKHHVAYGGTEARRFACVEDIAWRSA